jgi:hypothetical protein
MCTQFKLYATRKRERTVKKSLKDLTENKSLQVDVRRTLLDLDQQLREDAALDRPTNSLFGSMQGPAREGCDLPQPQPIHLCDHTAEECGEAAVFGQSMYTGLQEYCHAMVFVWGAQSLCACRLWLKHVRRCCRITQLCAVVCLTTLLGAPPAAARTAVMICQSWRGGHARAPLSGTLGERTGRFMMMLAKTFHR